MMQQTTGRRSVRWAGSLALATMALTGVALVTGVGVSSAHQPNIEASCEGGLHMRFFLYDGPDGNNVARVTIDGTTTNIPFGAGLETTIAWSPTVNHTYTVVLDANVLAGDPDMFDDTFVGSVTSCTPDTTSTTAPVTTTTAPDVTTTTAPDVTTTTAPDVTTTTTPGATTTTTPGATTTTTPGATTTTAAVTTTTAVASAPPFTVTPPSTATSGSGATPPVIAVAPPLAAPTGSQLPVTGSNTRKQVGLALLVLAAGLALISAARRRPTVAAATDRI